MNEPVFFVVFFFNKFEHMIYLSSAAEICLLSGKVKIV